MNFSFIRLILIIHCSLDLEKIKTIKYILDKFNTHIKYFERSHYSWYVLSVAVSVLGMEKSLQKHALTTLVILDITKSAEGVIVNPTALPLSIPSTIPSGAPSKRPTYYPTENPTYRATVCFYPSSLSLFIYI